MTSTQRALKSNSARKTIYTIISVLLLTTTMMFAAVATAQTDVNQVSTYAFINLAPNPVGVNQQVLVDFWVPNIPPLYPNGSESHWQNYTVLMTTPDGNTQTMGPYQSDPVGSCYFLYTPEEVGQYTFQFTFPEQTSITGDHMLSSVSKTETLTVQQDPIPHTSENPLPSGYWARPINQENAAWGQIAGNWLMPYYDSSSNPFNPYSNAPDSAHILWTKPLIFGGIVGGNIDGTTSLGYYSGGSYEAEFAPIIMNGRLYYNQRLGSSSWQGTACVDLRTGQQLWFVNGTTMSFGQLYDYESPNQHGVIPYLWSVSGTTYQMYDPFTGGWILNITNVPRGTMTFGVDGSILIYILDSTKGVLSLWNSSSIPAMLLGTTGTNAWQWRPPQGANLNGSTGIQWTTSVETLPGSPRISKVDPDDGVILASASFPTTSTGSTTYEYVGYSIKPGQEGQLLWVHNETINDSKSLDLTPARGSAMGDGVFTAWMKETMQWYCFSATNGSLLWTSNSYSNPWGMYSMGAGVIAYGNFYHAAFDGRVHCFNIATGNETWTYYGGDSGFNTPYGDYPFCSGSVGATPTLTIADGKVYAVNNEHSPSTPLYHGYKMHVIDAMTGAALWNVTGWYQNPAVADGYLATFNEADNQIYCYGPGQTATTVTAPDVAIPQGTPVLIKGTVTDQSPGQTSLGIPAAGTPAISDKDMSAWMAYLYMQQPEPTDATGVQVRLTAIDPNHNTQDIGNVTTDSTGNFALSWNPPVPGLYTVTATFSGSNSYYGSKAETAFVVSTSPSSSPSTTPVNTANPTQTTGSPSPTSAQTASSSALALPTQAVQPPASSMPTATYIAIGAAVVIIVALAAALVLRRRK